MDLFGWRLHAFGFSNHYHLLLEITETNLSRAVQWIQVKYSVWPN